MKQESQSGAPRSIDFIQPFTSPMQIHKGKAPVTRENFCSVIINNFAVAATNIYKGAIYFEWLRANCGFEYQREIRQFLHAGGWHAFSPEEQRAFLKAFDSVKAHHFGRDPNLVADVHANTAEELVDQLDAFTEPDKFADYAQDIPKFIRYHGPLNHLAEGEFLLKLRSWKT